MPRRHNLIPVALLFFVMAAAFSVIFWPDVSMAAKLAFFAAGIGCGVSIGRSVRRGSDEGKS